MNNETFYLTMAAVYGPLFVGLMLSAYYLREHDRQQECLYRERQERQRRRDQEQETRRLTTEEWRADFERRHGLS